LSVGRASSTVASEIASRYKGNAQIKSINLEMTRSVAPAK
jgi:hypothetical protein